MFKTVVWATDGSDTADRALPLAKTLAGEGGGELVVVHCEELMTPGPHVGRDPVNVDGPDVKAKVEGQVAELKGARLRIVTIGASGPAHAIAEVAREEHADVVVVGTRGRTPLAGLLVGSVTQRLLHIAPCPVLVVPPAK